MTVSQHASASLPARGSVARTESLLRLVLGTMLALSCVSFVEPSPYEFFFFLLAPVALLNGLKLTRTTLTLFLIIATFLIAQLVALMPYLEHQPVGDGLTPAMYTVYTVYLYASASLFAFLFSEHTNERLGLAIKAYTFSCVFAGAWGILSFMNVGGIGDSEPVIGRVAGPFKDPNVLGSYCIMGVLFLMQSILLVPRHRLFKLTGMAIAAVGGVFFSLSRGSMGAMVVAAAMMVISLYLTTQDKAVRRRIRLYCVGLCMLLGVGVAAVMTNPTLTESIGDRAKLAQDYDSGETGRFGNQRRSIPMLVERPLGFGPYRFSMYFGLAPHNSYIGAFAEAGWIGGLAFLLLVGSTSVLAIRLMFIQSAYRQLAQVVSPALTGFFLQAVQIDIDHWRFVHLMIGAVWGMESARRSDLRKSATSARIANGRNAATPSVA
jgi:hypothetical protein